MKHALTKYRETNELTLEAFAARIGSSKSQVWKWENLQAEPRPFFRKKIIEATSGFVTLVDLLIPYDAE